MTTTTMTTAQERGERTIALGRARAWSCPECLAHPHAECDADARDLPAGVHVERLTLALLAPRESERRRRAEVRRRRDWRRGYEKREAEAWRRREAAEKIHAAAVAS